jgi:hypothetical protein
MSLDFELRKRRAAAGGVALFSLCNLLLGCGQSPPTPAQASPSEKSPAVSAPSARRLDPATCGGFGLPQASAFLGVPEGQLKDESTQESWGKNCLMVGNAAGATSPEVSFVISTEDSPDAAQLSFAQLRDHAGVADGVIAGEGRSHMINGLGDEAVWVRASRSLYVRVGATTLTVSIPKEEERQIALARQLLQ